MTADSKSNPDGPSEICSAHLHFVLFVNLFLLIFIVTGCCLDAKKKLVFKPSYKQDAADVSNNQNSHKQVPNSSLSATAIEN